MARMTQMFAENGKKKERQIHSGIVFAPCQVAASFFIRQIRVISVPYRKIRQ
jgi:hypothetical protein